MWMPVQQSISVMHISHNSNTFEFAHTHTHMYINIYNGLCVADDEFLSTHWPYFIIIDFLLGICFGTLDLTLSEYTLAHINLPLSSYRPLLKALLWIKCRFGYKVLHLPHAPRKKFFEILLLIKWQKNVSRPTLMCIYNVFA